MVKQTETQKLQQIYFFSEKKNEIIGVKKPKENQ